MLKIKTPIKTLYWVLLFVICAGMFFPKVAQAQTSVPSHTVVIYMFWGDGCPHCEAARQFINSLKIKFSNIELKAYEVWYVPENQQLYKDMCTTYGFEARYVPTIFIGDHYWEGFNETIAKEMEDAIKACTTNGCSTLLPPTVQPALTKEPQNKITPTFTPVSPLPGNSSVGSSGGGSQSHIINLPVLGLIDLDRQSLTISTLLISFVDGINPCSIWVLTMLLALTLHTGSRRKVVLIGIIFLTVTAGIYALFITGLFSVLKIISFIGWIQIIVTTVALIFGLVNIKDYFWYKEGISFTIGDEKKPGIYKRMRALMDASQKTWGLVGATIVLAGGVSLVEFSCTAGFPMIWTNLLNSQNVNGFTFLLLLALYLLIYQLDELVIFFAAVYTMKATRMEEKGGRILKLIGGTLMLSLAIVMLVNPAIMNSLGKSMLVFAIAFISAGIVLLLHRVILPRFGIWIGSEKSLHRHDMSKKNRE